MLSRAPHPARRALRVALVALLILGVSLAVFSATTRFSRSRSILKQDGLGYLLYTRSLVLDLDTDITDDVALVQGRFTPDATESIDRFARRDAAGRVTLPWPVGIAYVMAPFYAVGWVTEVAVAGLRGRPPDTFGTIPVTAFALGSVLLSCLGVLWTFRLCCRFTERRMALVATGAAALGGPLVFYTFFHPTMSHGASFGLGAAWLGLWFDAWGDPPGRRPPGPLTESPTPEAPNSPAEAPGDARRLLLLGALFGLLVTIRYQSILLFPLPLALVVRRLRADGLRRATGVAARLGGAFLAVAALQLVHLAVNGGQGMGADDHGVSAAGNSFALLSPHFFEVLFSPKHGAFYWAPTLFLGALGLVLAARHDARFALLIGVVLLNTWLIGTLEDINWSAAAAFGMRYFTELTVVFALGLAALLQAAPARARRALVPVLALLALFNLALTVPYSLRVISQEDAVTWPEMARGIAESGGALMSKLRGGRP